MVHRQLTVHGESVKSSLTEYHKDIPFLHLSYFFKLCNMSVGHCLVLQTTVDFHYEM
jgi:hypothetical protein